MVRVGVGVGIVAVCDGEGPAGWRATLRVPACSIGFAEECAGYVGFGLGRRGLSEHGRKRGGEGE